MDNSILFLIVPIAIISYNGIRDFSFREKYIFNIDRILLNKEYFRLISSGFLHGNWVHLIFNMLALESFGRFIILKFGGIDFIVIYFGSLICGGLLSLYIHRNHYDYEALGASGAISGLIFSTIVSEPFSRISFFLIPIELPSWGVGIIFIIVSIVGIKKGIGKIGHDAHLGGAIFGIIATMLIDPDSLKNNIWVYLLLGLPSIGFTLFIIKNPNYLLADSISFKSYLPQKKRNSKGLSKEEEIDKILDKINEKGFENISEKEKKKLKKLIKD